MGNPNKPSVHKIKAQTSHGVIAICGRTAHSHTVSKYWSEVTCTNCLKQQKEPIDG